MSTRMQKLNQNYLANLGIGEWFSSVDHKRVGIMFLVSGLLTFLLGGAFALLIRTELATPGTTIMDAHSYNIAFTLHGTIMIFLFIVPGIISSFGNIFMPIQIGAPDVAFPKLNRLSFQIWLAGLFVILLAMINWSYVFDPGSQKSFWAPPDTGWTFYTPYSIKSNQNVVLMVLGAFVLGFSSVLTGLNFVVTIHKMRAKGMTWFRMPLFTWTIYSASLIQIVATPVIGITLLLLTFERFLGVGFFDPTRGGDPILFQHFFWFYSHPVVYIMILPAMGVVSEIIPCFSRKPIFGYKAIACSSLGITLISFLVWGHHLFLSGQNWVIGAVFSFLTFLVAIPTAIKVFNWITTMYKGQISLKSPMLYALAFVFLFAIGGLTGIFLGAVALDVPLHDTYFVVAHFHYTIQGGTVIALMAAIHYWFPKMTGRMYNEKWGVALFIFVFIGFNLTFIPQFIMGLQGMPRRYFDYLDKWQIHHFLSTIGAYLLGFGYFGALMNFVYSAFKGEKAGDNPWEAKSLEWSNTNTPPPIYNFTSEPEVSDWPYNYGQETEGEK